MNSKFFLTLISLVSLCGCGVKARPITPPEKAISSYVESYTGVPEVIPSNPIKEKKK
ncbi:MAG: hypothetical protein ACXVLQ_12090 [Bacteriovorax sp.]